MRGRVCTPCPVGPPPGQPFSSLFIAAPSPRIHWGILIFLLSALREPPSQMCFPFLVSPSKPLRRVPTLPNPSLLLGFPLLVSPAFAALDPCLCPGPSSILPGPLPPAAVESCLLPTRGPCEGKDDLSSQTGLPEGRVDVSLLSWGASRGPTRPSSQEHPPYFPWPVGLMLAGDLLPSPWTSAQRAVSADSQWDPGIPQVDD